MMKKKEPVYAADLAKDEGFIGTVKKDWYGQDHVYLQEHPESVFFGIFSKIESFENVFLDYFPQDAFIRQIQHITNFYLTGEEDKNRDFPYLSKKEMDRFLEETVRVIEDLAG